MLSGVVSLAIAPNRKTIGHFIWRIIGFAPKMKGLHEGNIARYRLRLSEFRAWKAKQR